MICHQTHNVYSTHVKLCFWNHNKCVKSEDGQLQAKLLLPGRIAKNCCSGAPGLSNSNIIMIAIVGTTSLWKK